MPRRFAHLTRTTFGLLLAIAAWVGLVALAFWVVDRPFARAWVAREVTRRAAAAIGQPVRIADLHLSLTPPRIEISGLEIGPAGAPAVRVAEAEVTVGDLRLAEREIGVDHLRLKGVRVDVESAPSPGKGPGGWISVVVRQLELEDVQIAKLALPGGIVISAHDVDARWTGTRRSPISSAVAHVGSFTFRAPGFEPVAGTLMAWGRKTGTGWDLGRLRARGPQWSVDAAGTVSGTLLRAQGTAEFELAELDRTVGIGADLEGRVSTHWQASLQGSDFRVDGSVNGARVSVAGLDFEALSGEAHVSPDGLEATVFQVGFAGGKFEGSYTLRGLRAPFPHKVVVRGDGASLAAFLKQLGADDAGLSATCRVNADVAWDGSAFKRGVGTGVAELRPGNGDVPVGGKVIVSLDQDGALAFNAPDAVLAGRPLSWNGKLALGTWVPSWSVKGEGTPVRIVARLLRGWVGADVLPPQLKGDVVADVTLSGPFKDLDVTGTVAVTPVSFGPVEADGLEGSFHAGRGVLSVSGGLVHVGPGSVRYSGDLRYGQASELRLDLEGEGVPLERVVAWGGVHGPFAGTVGFVGSVTGTVTAPRAAARLRLADVAAAGVPLGAGTASVRLENGIVVLEGLAVGPLSASARVDLGRNEAVVDAGLSGFGLEAISPPLARIAGGALDCTLHGAFPFDSPGGRLELTSRGGAQGTVELDAQSLRAQVSRPGVWRLASDLRRAAGEFRGTLDFEVDSLHALVKELSGGELPIEGSTDGTATVRLAPPKLPVIDGSLRRLEVSVEGEHAALEKPAHFIVDGAAVRLDGATLVGKRANLFVRGARDADGSLSGNVSGELPGELLGIVWSEARPKGRVELLGEISGTDSAPRFEGIGRVSDGSLRLPGLPEPAARIAGVVEFTPEVVRLDGVSFALLGGTGTCGGSVVLSPSFQLDLAIRAEDAKWPLAVGLRPGVTGDLRLVGPLDQLVLSGKLTMQHTIYRSQADLQKLVVENLRARERARSEEGAPITLNITVDVPSTFEIVSPLARLTAKGSLRIVGTTASYGVIGRLEALPGGELEFSGTRYELDRGIVTFSNPERMEPRLDVLARTTVQAYDITVGLIGTLDHLTPTFSSIPALPEMDIVSLLVVGRRASEATSTETGAAASSFLTGELTGAVTRRARSLLDVDQLQVDPFASTQTGSPTARLTVSKQLTRDWLVVVSTNLTANREEIVTSRWRLAQGIYLEAAREADGSLSMVVKWQRRY